MGWSKVEYGGVTVWYSMVWGGKVKYGGLLRVESAVWARLGITSSHHSITGQSIHNIQHKDI